MRACFELFRISVSKGELLAQLLVVDVTMPFSASLAIKALQAIRN
jgi:hypothetical protein